MSLSRRRALEAFGALAGGVALGGIGRFDAAPADGVCPAVAGRRIRWIVPHAAGGGYDSEARLIQPLLAQRLGARLHVDNQPGAGGIAGARAVAAARPDGRTLGFLGMPGLLLASLMGRAEAPDPARDFAILGRVARSWHVWATGGRSPLTSIEQVMEEAARRPLLFGVNEVGSTSFVGIAAAAALLNVPVELVAGFPGTRSTCLAALTGDLDLVSYNYETIRPLIASGDLRPLLQISTTPIEADGPLAGVPVLGGGNGLAARRARAQGSSAMEARRRSSEIEQVIGSGRVIVAPAGLGPDLETCLARVVHDALTSDALRLASRRALDTASASEARDEVEAAVAAAPALLPVVAETLRRLRS